MDVVFQEIRDSVNGTDLPAENRQTALWCLDQLPPLYRELERTCDSRFADQIVRLAEGLRKGLGEKGAGPRLAQVILGQLCAMHERLGLPGLTFKIPATKGKSRKKIA